MNSLYELDPKWQKLLNTNNFLGGLTVNEFVEELSSSHIKTNHNVDGNRLERLDSKPFIRTFESTLKELKSLNENASNRKTQLANEVSRQELIHAENILQLSSNLKKMTNEYNILDNQLSSVTQVVSPLGDKLENAIRKKRTYIKSVELITQYNEFYSKGKSLYFEQLRNSTDWNEKIQAATLMKNLLILAIKIETSSIPKTSQATKIIEKYSELMENQLLDNFNSAYRDNNFNKLNEIALILNHFNGGVNVIQNFINQHAYFIDSTQIEIDEEYNNSLLRDEEYRRKLVDPDVHSVAYEQTIVTVLNDIETIIKNESKIVKRVFEERAAHVIQLFIQRIYAQKIEPKIDYLLNTSLTLSNLAYVRTLHGLYSLLGQFSKDLTEYFQLLEIDNNNSLIHTLEQTFQDMFSRYVYDRSRYFDIERRSLEAILLEKTSTFNFNHTKEIRPRLLSNKFQKTLETGGLDLNEFGNNTQNAKSRLSQFNQFLKNHLDMDTLNLNRSNTINRNDQEANDINDMTNCHMNDMTNDNIDSQITIDKDYSVENADAMLRCVVEAVARVMELMPNKANDYSFELLEVMLIGVINSYVDAALETAYYYIDKIDVTKATVINISSLTYISTSTEILSLVSTSVKAVFLPLLNNSPIVKKKIVELTNGNIKKIELLINIIMEKIVQLFSSKFTYSLSKQKKKDFSPKSQELLDQDTLPAIEIVNVLVSLKQQADKYLKAQNLESFLNGIGEDLYTLLLSHYSKFQVSSIGGIIVTKDIIGYQNVMEEWQIPNLLEKFATLRELANLFTVQPDLLDSLTKEGHLADMNREMISKYISNREDFNHENFITNMKMNLRQYT